MVMIGKHQGSWRAETWHYMTEVSAAKERQGRAIGAGVTYVKVEPHGCREKLSFGFLWHCSQREDQGRKKTKRKKKNR